MHLCGTRCGRKCLAGGFIVFALTTTVFGATTNRWTNSVSGLWRTGPNWSSNVPPDSTFGFILITNSGTKTVTIDALTPSTNLTVQALTVSAPTGFTNTLALVDVTTNLPLQVSGALRLVRGGAMTLTNSEVNSAGVTLDGGGTLSLTNSLLKETGFTVFDIVNGSAWLDSGLMVCSAIQYTRIGRTNNALGNLIVNGGTMFGSEIQVAASSGSQGILTIGGGTLDMSSTLTAGFGASSTGTVSVTAGQLIATNGNTYIGGGSSTGFGQMNVSGGNVTLANLSVGPNGNGQLTVTGGQLTVKPKTTNDMAQIGFLGNGQFNVSGGSVLLLSDFRIGDDQPFDTGSGTVSLTGGQLIATNDITSIGKYSQGQMTVSNATALLTNVSVGRHDGAVGTLNVQSNAQVYLLDALSIARFSNSVGHVLVTGGLLSLTNDTIWVGREGTGDMTISNGTVRALAALVGVSTVVTDSVTMLPLTNVPGGTLTLAGGSLVLTSNLVVGTSSISTGQVAMVGGNLVVTNNAHTAYLSVAEGTFSFSQGAIAVDALFATNITGQFQFNGGVLQTRSITVANGTPFVVGDGVNPATLQLLGGTYSFAGGLVVSSNATVSGCGTILGSITNQGTIATNCGPAGVTITATTKTGATATVFFTTLNGSNHVLEYKNTLNATGWTAILPGVIGNGGVTNKTDTSATVPSRFYRIHVQ
jgi:T5SS/PEP-CTERM-associated repeat protein